MTVGIEHLCYFVPDKQLSNEVCIKEQGLEEAFVKNKLGIHMSYVAGEREYVSDWQRPPD